MPQKEIQKEIDLGNLVYQCMITGRFKVPSTGQYVGFRLKEPYKKISHGYEPEQGENYLLTYRMLRKYRSNNTPLYED